MIKKRWFKNIFINIKNKGLKNKKLLTYLWIILFIYIILIGFAKTIQSIATFPAIFVNVQDIVWHIDTDLDFEEINIKDTKWNNINWLYLAAWTWSKTVYYFHWNWWPLNYFYDEIKYINSLGFNVMAYDYPGYWKSTWFPYKDNVDRFSDTFYKEIKSEKQIKDNELIIWWYSVWTAVATDFANKYNFERLVLVSPFSSRYEMANKTFWFNLAKILFLDDSYNTKLLVKRFIKPVLIIHWNNDKIVPFDQWKKIFENYWALADVDKTFIELDNFWHNYIIDSYWNALKWFFNNFLNWWKLNIKNDYIFIWKDKKMELELIKSKLDFINNLDLETDSSITKFVNSKVSFNNKKYIPKNLEKLSSNYVYDSKWWRQIIRKVVNENLQNLAKSFYEKFNKKLVVVSAYRSYAYQKWIKDRWCPDNLCSKAWFSEHQSGLALDIFEASSKQSWKNNSTLQKYYKWLDENAYKYGFHNTYQKWLQIDWYEIEPWHWRYVWKELASYLKEKNITIAEFYFNKNK